MVEYAISTVAGIVFLYLVWKKPAWTGMRGKTLWNWIALLLVPTSVSFGTYLIGMAQQRAELENRREAAIQNYFDRISSLVLTENRGLDDVSLAIGRAHTAAILKQATGEAGGRIVLFLTEMGLLEVYVDSLEALDLQHVAFYQSHSVNRKRVRPKGEAAFFCFRLNATCSKPFRVKGNKT